jgi:hypothetical protein
MLLTSLALGINQLASKIDLNIDLTQESRYTLCQETLAWLAKLEKPVDIIITVRETNNQPKIIQRLLLDINLLLDAFERAPSSFPIRIHRVDVNARKAQKTLIEKYNLAEPNLILVATQGEENIEKEILFRFDDQPATDTSDPKEAFRSRDSKARDAVFDSGIYNEWGENDHNVPEPTKFRGEEVILRSLLRVSRVRKGTNVVYFTRGHGERSPSDANRNHGFSEFQKFLESRNLEVATLAPDPNARIPEDAALVVVTSPQVPFRAQEVARLRTFLSERQGNLMLLLDPVVEQSIDSPPAFGFHPLLKEWGLRCHDMLVHDPDISKFDVFSGDYSLGTYSRDEGHPVVAPLIRHGLSVYAGKCRPVERESTPPEQIEATELIYSSRTSWGISDWRAQRPTQVRNDLLDITGPVPVASLSEKKLRPRHEVKLKGGKVAVMGSSQIFANRILKSNAGNRTLLRNLVHWFLDESEMLDIPPKEIINYNIKMNEKQFEKLLYSTAYIPSVVALLGLFVYWLRKDILAL